MKSRRAFLEEVSLSALVAGFPESAKTSLGRLAAEGTPRTVRPRALRKGAKVALIAPASPASDPELNDAGWLDLETRGRATPNPDLVLAQNLVCRLLEGDGVVELSDFDRIVGWLKLRARAEGRTARRCTVCGRSIHKRCAWIRGAGASTRGSPPNVFSA